MSNYIKIVAVFYFLLVVPGFAQGTGKGKTTEIDTLKNTPPLSVENLLNQQNAEKLNLLKHKVSIKEMYKLYFLYGEGLINNYMYNGVDFSNLSAFPFANNTFISYDSLNYFNQNLSQILALKYKELTKYDLGTVGQYLGIGKDIFAAILATLSLRQ